LIILFTKFTFIQLWWW